MKIIYEFADGAVSEVEVTGKLVTEYCVMAGVDPEEPPKTLKMSEIERRADRKHIRPHKYTGLPVSLDEAAESGEEAADSRDDYAEIDAAIDDERALASLTELQRYCFVEVRLKGRTQSDVAREIGKSRSNVQYAVETAAENLKKYFS